MEAVEKPGYCTLCRSRCGTLNTVRGDMLVEVRPDPAHPTGGAMCMKGRAAPELVHSPHRLMYPMRRTRPKGDADPGWVRISWDEALDEVAARLARLREESGAESVVFAVTTPSGTPLSDSIDWIERFVRRYGSPNICYATEICNWHKDVAHAFTFGRGMPTPDYENADLILLWGHNPAAAWLAQANAIGRGRARGARMMVVDPRRTALAAQADSWLAVRPGSDAALALGLARLLIESGRYDAGFVRCWTNGPLLVREDNGEWLRERDVAPAAGSERFMVWDSAADAPCAVDTGADPQAATSVLHGAALRGAFAVQCGTQTVRCRPAFDWLAQAVEAYTPEHVEALTWVPAERLREAATLIAEARRIAYHAWSGVAQHTNASQTERAIAVLYALTGAFDATGGNRIYPTLPARPISELGQLDASQRAKALGLAARPLGPPAQGWVTARDTYRAILEGRPYRVRALFGFGANPLSSQGDFALASEALQALEFHVHCDLFETPTARYADILLPVGTPWEREGLRVGFELDARSQGRVQWRPAMVSPRGEARSDNDIVFALAQRLGMAEDFFGGSLEAGWNHMLAPLGLDVATLRKAPGGVDLPLPARERLHAQADEQGGVRGFATETRRVELYSAQLRRHGYAPVPEFVAPDEATRAGDAFPIVLGSAKNGYFCHSQHRSVVSLRKRALAPQIEIGAALAQRQGIVDGDAVRVTTRHGSARFIARVSEALDARVAIAEFGWWQACPEIGAPGYALCGPGNSHYNGLISAQACDPLSGSVAHRSFQCRIVPDPDQDVRHRAWRDWAEMRVTALHALAEGALGIELEPLSGGLPDFMPGQHLMLAVPTRDARPGLTRAYSLTSNARDAARRSYTVAVRHQRGVDAQGVPCDGAMSSYLHTRLAVGERLLARAPSGRFTLPLASPQPVVLIAGGIGITPFVSLLETLAAHPMSGAEIVLHYANRDRASHAFRSRLRELAAQLPGLTVHDYYDRASETDRAEGVRAGRISDAVVPAELIARRARVYLCGPEPMMQAVRNGLIARGMPAFDIFHEAFRSPPRVVEEPGGPFRVTLRRSGRQLDWRAGAGTLLSFAERQGVDLPSGCRAGQCESCAVRVIRGEVRHLGASAPEDPDTCLTCQAVPLSDLELDA